MKKFLLANFLTIGMSAFAQTYCIPAFAEGCDSGDQINSFEIPTAGFSQLETGCSQSSYEDFTAQIISLNAGVNYPFTITHGYGTQKVKIWIDFDNNGIFDEDAQELVAFASSTGNGEDTEAITHGTILIPLTVTPGNYRMRVGDRFSSNPEPCNELGYGEVHDYTVAVGAVPNCLAPGNLAADAITSNSAVITWTASSSTPGTGYEYYYSVDNTAPLNTTAASGNVGASVVSAPLSNLASNTTYYVWVRSACSTSEKSGWSIGTTFTTQCGVVVPAYTFDFSDFPNDCWSQASGGDATNGPTGDDENWYGSYFLNDYDGENEAAAIGLYGSDNAGWLKTVAFDLSAGNYTVTFDYGAVDFWDVTFSGMGSDDVIQFLVSGDGGTTWTVLQEWNAENPPSETSANYSYGLSAYTGANTVFAFYGSSGTAEDDADYEFFVDNFNIEASSLGTSETAKPKETVKAYPNPFTDVLNISKAELVKTVLVTEVSGRLVKTIENPSSALHLADLKQGLYFVTLVMKDGSKQMIKAIKK
ncbi:MAG: GEVED domain-containing protein [Chryseobacterium sp.]|jgi:hypothetical protein|uniref:GEVED domain-containing protein n=1 Tax=Chryseobacterium sp. TaxID=1871047 RepID=UPI00282449BD|nr:GEVED domain-containing protein [Chryseobacterium sp.]MDR2238473.1 GEVED domain-containing protein [Chryseobacterium sp.]